MSVVLLLSGGIDSTALAYWQRPKHALTIDYGQAAASAERRAAAQVARELELDHHNMTVNLRALGLGRMAGLQPEVDAPTPEWWPFRNQLLITFAAAKAVVLGADAVMVGTLATDGLHADGRPEFLETMRSLFQQQERQIKLLAPASKMNALQLVRRSGVPRQLLAWTHSCHVADYACGTCRGCNKHIETLDALKT
ncbi:7-cyano-7-deazaguanine synthase [uncultured Pseudacidovorax sp.]|uniref:7-cyano-7-deazaguanine synthase n=1 Tax=uncultured Pseudacidovorax sp. TaxID=679313 RepID=UPI0026015F35|nr:7-cyano-7-deazaguanine synthase [uncultured Pseudacidovorax sp.]